MHCNEFCDRLDDLLDAREDISSDAAIAAHMNRCERCAHYFDMLRDALDLIESQRHAGADRHVECSAASQEIAAAAVAGVRQPAEVASSRGLPTWTHVLTVIAATVVIGLFLARFAHWEDPAVGTKAAEQQLASDAPADQPQPAAVGTIPTEPEVLLVPTEPPLPPASELTAEELEPVEEVAAGEAGLVSIGQLAKAATQGSWQLVRESPRWTEAFKAMIQSDQNAGWPDIQPLARSTGEAVASIYGMIPQPVFRGSQLKIDASDPKTQPAP